MIPKEQLQRYQTLSRLQVMCRSTSAPLFSLFAKQTSNGSKQGSEVMFTDRTRLDQIQKEVKDTPFACIKQGKLSEVYAQVTEEQLKEMDSVILISSHVDMVSNIKECFCLYSEQADILKGTFDNTVTNAVSVNLMKYHNLPEHVLFTFNGDEETGRCGGAKEALHYLTNELGFSAESILPIALDVTYEGFTQCHDFSIENLASKEKTNPLIDFILKRVSEDQNFTFVRSQGHRSPSNVPSKCISKDFSWFDEGVAYARMGCDQALSFCLPCGKGDMHSNKGVYVHGASFLAYEQALGTIAKQYALSHIAMRNSQSAMGNEEQKEVLYSDNEEAELEQE